ncbi:hypothetical protein KUTeg_008667 [Tegillarca granosa]|uniref:Integrin beta n=1 Tax=Tegillarca granosa TaxID=220873 RepID=A0ABQ9F9U2_TEGGR|nr:hypothetical protein KUTeg_008667 [Tegillarca granosa]
MKLITFVLSLLILQTVTAQTSPKKEEFKPSANDCKGKTSCGECLEAGPNCAFCTAVGYDDQNIDRCDEIDNHAQCPPDQLMFPRSDLSKTEDFAVKDGEGVGNEPIQIRPQRIKLDIRQKDPNKFTMQFRLAENYPVDLYYLMDLSHSMKDDKNKLAELGNLIAADMKTITKDFKLGFGSFVDKVVMPYVSTHPNKTDGSPTRQSPCTGCAPPYGFKNELKLDIDTNKFAQQVRQAQVSGNLDSPEGGFDAIMQTVVCDGEIGWRNKSRRMVLFSTDAGFHFAGDGKLGGIVKPNDGICHLDNTGIYTQSTHQDYPSVSQIAAKIKEKNVNIIFAVTEDQVLKYSELSKFIPGSETGKLANDSSNIVKLVRTNYEKITSKVEMVATKLANTTVKFFSRCKSNVTKETNVCENLNIGDTVTFDVEIEVTKCPADSSKNDRKLVISPVGLGDQLEIDLKLLCQCECEKHGVANHTDCRGKGTAVCGTCECNPGFYGKNCVCSSGNVTSEEKEAECFMC